MKAVKLAIIGLGMMIGFGQNVEASISMCPKPKGHEDAKKFISELVRGTHEHYEYKDAHKDLMQRNFNQQRGRKLKLMTPKNVSKFDKKNNMFSTGAKCCYRFTTLTNSRISLNKVCNKNRECFCVTKKGL